MLSAYDRAVRYSLQYRYEGIQKKGTHNDSGFSAGNVGEDLEGACVNWDHSRRLSAGDSMKSPNTVAGMDVDIGLDHDWYQSFYKGERSDSWTDGTRYTSYLRGVFYDEKPGREKPSVIIPKRKDGTDYQLEDLNQKQQIVVLSSIDTMIKFITNDSNYRPL